VREATWESLGKRRTPNGVDAVNVDAVNVCAVNAQTQMEQRPTIVADG
jgi:hypothetical protein